MTRVRVGVCDGDPLVQLGLAAQIQDDPELSAVGPYDCGADALAAGLNDAFDILLVDLQLPDMTGNELVTGLKAGAARCRLIYVTAFPPAPVDVQAGSGMIAGLIAKNTTAAALAAAIKAADLGLSVASAGFLASVTNRPRATLARNDREAHVLECMCRGLSNTAIAADLHLSVSTVKNVVAGLLLDSGARTRTELVFMESSGAPRVATTRLSIVSQAADRLVP